MMTRDDAALRASYARLMELRRRRPTEPTVPAETVQALAEGSYTGADREDLLDRVLSDAGMLAEFRFFRDVHQAVPKAEGRRWFRQLRPIALAASAILAVALGARLVTPGAEPFRGDRDALRLVSPGPTVAPGAVWFTWHPVPGAAQYELEVAREDGASVATAATTDTTASATLPPAPAALRWWVTARREDGTSVRSTVQALAVRTPWARGGGPMRPR